jgi:hypothetical protein
VHHEAPDYVYEPHGLLAESWGKTGPRTEVADFIRRAQLQERKLMDDDAARDAFEFVQSLDDATVLAGRIDGSPEHAEICRRLKPVNAAWVTMQCANTAYARGLIDERELDRIAEEG